MMNGVVALLRGSRWKLAGAGLAGALSGLGIAALIALINSALALPRAEQGRLLPAFVALCVGVFLARTASEALLVRLSQHLIAGLRCQLSRQILASPLRQLEQHGAHRLLAALTDDVQKIAALLTRLPTFCINVAVALGCFAYLGWLSWPLMLGALACIGIGIGVFLVAQLRAQGALQRSRDAGDELYKHFITVTEGGKELQMHRGRRSAFLTRWLDGAVARLRHNFVSGMTIYALAESLGLLMFFVFIGLLLFLPPDYTTHNPAVLSGYALTFLYLITPVEVLVNLAPDFGQFRVALKQLATLQLALAPGQDHGAGRPAWKTLQQLELKGVTHGYRSEHEDGQFTLGPIDLSLSPGEIVFITGGNGSGKTTLAKLLVGLYAPDSGQVSVNGEAVVGDADREAYRQLFSCVFADFYLFEELLGLDDPERAPRAGELLKRLKLDHKVSLEKGRFSTVALSQGQRKRLALLGAVLEDRPVCLFDEWAADQDPVFKRVFYEDILPDLKAQGRTVVAITHDDAYFHLADRHVKLESGRIVSIRSQRQAAACNEEPVAAPATPGRPSQLQVG
ncbi:cyclic peptide export ABC transporter [Caldimonas brevitalea]|uniref:Putative ATP-binding cassette transporter n=1 Tax=Caldimonas brevitalea TaxID=413882 RepID=A0A0G3BJA9_9BURK|nr:cyclic peptide export ABC transporter [Caldimonas brevitalea]AKJ29462.1 putative ATP-binding cassette transporter [Caldimonas brevitalea]